MVEDLNRNPRFCIDVHTHLTDGIFQLTINDVIERARASNVKAAIVVSESISDFEPVLNLCNAYPTFILPCLGIHPIQSTGSKDERGIDIKRSVNLKDYEGVEKFIEKSLETIGGIGEIGLDFTPRFCKSNDDKEQQKSVFSKQVQLAQKHDLPIRSTVLAHAKTEKHARAKRKNCTDEEQGPSKKQKTIDLTKTVSSEERNNICKELVSAFAAANTPLSKVDHPAL
ncbi:3'-5' ssDNA/RNA exonuclease tatd [Plakobranchus ocellatus]|uniref:3'-5' ssDNA/RNA exonuclease tatd n=1 Tax=Plakobranchus ocellatus TaxID=259542 RepID=A0AAV4BCR4_9GAST|nr:3'-5' ssDNA/RNA exonuclease tatd [Plakobranchus ocellatus]